MLSSVSLSKNLLFSITGEKLTVSPIAYLLSGEQRAVIDYVFVVRNKFVSAPSGSITETFICILLDAAGVLL